MFPVNRNEMYLASAAGEYEGDLPEPVTRKEIFLNGIASRMGTFNRNLDALAGVTQIASWSDVQKAVRSGIAGKIFSIGDQLTCQRGNDTLVWDIIGIDHDTPADPQFTHSMTLQLHDCFPTVMQFDEIEAFYYCETAMPAGTYCFTIDSTYDATYNDLTSYQFTLTQAVPAGGQLCFGWTYNTQASAAKVTSFASATSTTALEQVAVSEGTGGRNIGELTIAGDFSNNLNSIQRARYGSNNYKESAIKQWLNSSAAAGSVWTPQTNFDRPPTWKDTAAGFMNGMDADFLAAIGKTHIVTARNTTCDGGGYDETDDYFFLLSRSEVYGGAEVSGVNEGEPYPCYANHSILSAPSMEQDSNRIKYGNGAAQYWWNRTPTSGKGSNVRVVHKTGYVHDNGVNNSYGVAPACNVI